MCHWGFCKQQNEPVQPGVSDCPRVIKQKSFNKSMVDSSTAVIFLDEAYTNLLAIDDWKIICQGGFTSHDVKWKKAQVFHCRASMYMYSYNV